jgi:hypothetical protein
LEALTKEERQGEELGKGRSLEMAVIPITILKPDFLLAKFLSLFFYL